MAVTTHTALDLIARAMKLVNLLGGAETPDATEASDYLETVNDMLDVWRAQRLLVDTVPISNFNLVPGTQLYTLGDGGTLNLVPRPARITGITTLLLSNPVQPLELPLRYTTDEGEWAQIPVKNISSLLPQIVYDDCAYPLRNLRFFPIPQSAIQVNIYSWQAIQGFIDLVTQYSFPPAYYRAMRYSLAVELCAENGLQVPPIVGEIAVRSLETIKSINRPSMRMVVDPALVDNGGGTYNWLTDDAETGAGR